VWEVLFSLFYIEQMKVKSKFAITVLLIKYFLGVAFLLQCIIRKVQQFTVAPFALPHWPDASCLDSLLSCAAFIPAAHAVAAGEADRKKADETLSSLPLYYGSSFWW
jgi:hypothetical protein